MKKDKSSATDSVSSMPLLAEHYLVNDGSQLHLINADNWSCGGNGLKFEKDGERVAWFLRWDWWKRVDA